MFELSKEANRYELEKARERIIKFNKGEGDFVPNMEKQTPMEWEGEPMKALVRTQAVKVIDILHHVDNLCDQTPYKIRTEAWVRAMEMKNCSVSRENHDVN